MKTKTINNLDYFERENDFIEIVVTAPDCEDCVDSVLVDKVDWYQLIDWLLDNDELIKSMIKARRSGRISNRALRLTDKRFEEDVG